MISNHFGLRIVNRNYCGRTWRSINRFEEKAKKAHKMWCVNIKNLYLYFHLSRTFEIFNISINKPEKRKTSRKKEHRSDQKTTINESDVEFSKVRAIRPSVQFVCSSVWKDIVIYIYLAVVYLIKKLSVWVGYRLYYYYIVLCSILFVLLVDTPCAYIQASDDTD